MDAVLRKNDRPLSSFGRILDFGCGCGRLIRHLPAHTGAELSGSDYNPALIEWCRDNLPFATFETNGLAPPLAFPDASFDFIYARSVFTHLPEDLQHLWIRELHRVLAPGGTLYLTMHGRPLARGLDETQRARFEAGELVVTFATLAGDNLCSTYATRAFVERELLDGFTLAGFIEGRDAEHLRQDVYLLQKV
jgi:SAM-dependent methyltransferase